MDIRYLRSSSYSCHDMCEMKYFLEYVLGHRGPSNIKAEKGTIVHKALEILAIIKLNEQNGIDTFEDDVIGHVDINNYDIDDIVEKCYEYYKSYSIHEYKPLDLKHCKVWTHKAIEYEDGLYDPRNCEIVQPEQAFDIEINQPWAMYEARDKDGKLIEGFWSIKGTIDQISKIDDNTYQILDWKGLPIETPIPTPKGWSTMGELKVGDMVFDMFANQTKVIGKSKVKVKPCYEIVFDDNVKVECDNEHLWVLNNDSAVSIKELRIGDKIPKIQTEQIRDYNRYRTIKEINSIEPKLTQCIMVDSPTSTYLCTKNMIPTHNTGKRINWATGEEKTYAKLTQDHQLMMYFYAVCQLYPDIENIQLVIYFINDGGPFTICFSRSDLPKIENILRDKFEYIANTEMPALNKTWKCTKFCHFGRNTFEGTNILPIVEQRENQVCKRGTKMTMCEQTKYCLENRSLNSVVKNMSAEGFDVGFYKAPGSV